MRQLCYASVAFCKAPTRRSLAVFSITLEHSLLLGHSSNPTIGANDLLFLGHGLASLPNAEVGPLRNPTSSAPGLSSQIGVDPPIGAQKLDPAAS